MVPEFYLRNPYKADAPSDLENDAKLALHIVLSLLSTQDSESGCWNGGNTGATLRNTCHALEALHAFGREIASSQVESGIAWLVNFPDHGTLSEEDEELTRLYPSRFKTLAWLGEFKDSQLKRDFEELGTHLDEDGAMQGVMPKQMLATMVYADCLDHLVRLDAFSAQYEAKRNKVLDHIEQTLVRWRNEDRAKWEALRSMSAGDLSYAVDLLLRADRLKKGDSHIADILPLLITTVNSTDTTRAMVSDTLYCAIQLASHFPESAQARQAVNTFIARLRMKYEKLDLKKETAFFHPLVLRVLLAFHCDNLRNEVMRLLLDHERRTLEAREQNGNQALTDDFKTLIKTRFEVDVTDVQSLSGGITRATVFRVFYSLKLRTIGDEGEPRTETIHTSPGSLVIKRDSLDTLQTSIRRYRSLPTGLRHNFAKHEGTSLLLQSDPAACSYLILEDLTHMKTFRDILDRLDQRTVSRLQKEDLLRACSTVCQGLFELQGPTRRGATEFFGSQLSRLYIADIEKNLIRMCRPEKFPNLKTWLRGFCIGDRRYLSIEHYLRRIESHEAKLKVPYLTLIHGDCHSRNIMLDTSLQHLKLIDLDHVDYDGDYIKDFALLIEDICVFRFLFDEGYRFFLDRETVHFVTSSNEPRAIENRIEYPTFTSEAVRLFQQHMMARLEQHAQATQDRWWQQRLWLALASSLIYLVSRQTDKLYASVLYTQAINLLDELVLHLDQDVSLQSIPFPEAQSERPIWVPESGEDTLPVWHKQNALLRSIHDAVMALSPEIIYKLSAKGQVVRYFHGETYYPFAVIDGKKQPPITLLPCAPRALDDPEILTKERSTESVFQTIVPITEKVTSRSLVHLIGQVLNPDGW